MGTRLVPHQPEYIVVHMYCMNIIIMWTGLGVAGTILRLDLGLDIGGETV